MARWLLSAVVALFFTTTAYAADANEVRSAVVTPDGAFSIKLTTLRELRYRESFRTTIRQQYDYSCGSAAVATLLNFHYNVPMTEEHVFRTMFANGDQEKIRRDGFSLLDMKKFLEGGGFQADGFNVKLEDLAEAKVPAIALVREAGYNHFVVIKGVHNDKVLVGNPSSGTRVMTRQEFEAIWSVRILLVVRNNLERARFNVADHWVVRRSAPIGEGILRDAVDSMTVLMRPGFGDF